MRVLSSVSTKTILRNLLKWHIKTARCCLSTLEPWSRAKTWRWCLRKARRLLLSIQPIHRFFSTVATLELVMIQLQELMNGLRLISLPTVHLCKLLRCTNTLHWLVVMAPSGDVAWEPMVTNVSARSSARFQCLKSARIIKKWFRASSFELSWLRTTSSFSVANLASTCSQAE